MRHLIFFFTALAAFAQQPSSNVTVQKKAGPPKALIFEVVIPAPLPDVWRAFSTSEGLSTWLSPNAVVDLRRGGEWTAKFPGGSTGGGTILDFVANREVTMSAMAPDKFPTVRAERTRAVFQFEPKSASSTLVRLTQTGWKEGKEWDDAYEYLSKGNPQLLEALRKRFVDGPTDWEKVWGPAATRK